jgi:hypothetical protein
LVDNSACLSIYLSIDRSVYLITLSPIAWDVRSSAKQRQRWASCCISSPRNKKAWSLLNVAGYVTSKVSFNFNQQFNAVPFFFIVPSFCRLAKVLMIWFLSLYESYF